MHYFLVGIGGSGMSPLADLLRGQGHDVSGSDRSRDQGKNPEKFAILEGGGIRLYPQDGSGVGAGVDCVVVSSAIEPSIPDVQAAMAWHIPIIKRAEVLAGLFDRQRGIGIAGTSGKTTVTGMTGWMLHAMGHNPTIANGGVMPNFIGHKDSLMGSAVQGNGDLFVAEMDESDGSIALFTPVIAVLNNITLDHKPFDVIEPLFRDFLIRAREAAIINLDDERAAKMARVHPRTLTFGIEKPEASLNATGLQSSGDTISFAIHDRRDGSVYPCRLMMPGRHNVLNALAALCVAVALGCRLDQAIAALEGFSGIHRRLEIVGVSNGITVIDDFGHNPDKIAASLEALTAKAGRILIMFQPHGFGPMKLMREGIVQAFVKGLRPGDMVVMPEIFYAGGTVTRDISSADLIGDMRAGGVDARFCQTRDDAGRLLMETAKAGDRIVVMGARDDTLTDFARSLLMTL